MHTVAESLATNPPSERTNGRRSPDFTYCDAKGLAAILKLTAIPVLPGRMIAVFLEKHVMGDRFEPTDLVMRLLSQSLLGFIHASGGQMVYATDFDERGGQVEKEVAPVYRVVTTDAGTFRIQEDGYVFIHLLGQRFVVEYHRSHIGGGETECTVKVHTTGDSKAFYEQWSAYTRQHHYLRGRAAFADGEPIIHSRRYTWDDVILSDEARSTIRTHVETFLANIAQLKASGMKARRGLILAGPPGTGKSLAGKVLADTLGVTFLWVLPRHVRSTRSIVEIITTVRFLSPAVVFFEDLDLFGEDRDSSHSNVLGELMNQLDGVSENNGIVAIATTNRLDVVEKALRNRPGRFDRVVELGLPNAVIRRKILYRLLKNAQLAEADLSRLAETTNGYTPAQLEELVNTMHLLAAERNAGIDHDVDRKSFTSELIERALVEFGVEQKRPIGF